MAREARGLSLGASVASPSKSEGESGILTLLGSCSRCAPASPPLCKGLLSLRILETFRSTAADSVG